MRGTAEPRPAFRAGTPKPIIDELNDKFSEAVSAPDSVEFFRKLGNDVLVMKPEAARKFYEQDFKNWGEYVTIAKIEPQG